MTRSRSAPISAGALLKPRQALPAQTEAQFQASVCKLAKLLGYEIYHTRFSIGSKSGFPDLVLVHPERKRILYRELKRDGKDPTPKQVYWIDTLAAAGADVGVWRPADWERVERELR